VLPADVVGVFITALGKLPAEAVVARVRSADVAQLDIWGDRVLTAATLDELFDAA
jgi:hypothetical protein